jgi:hypothetical protein
LKARQILTACVGLPTKDRVGWFSVLHRIVRQRRGCADSSRRWTGRTEGLAAGSGYFADAPLIVPIDNLWWRVPITL